MCSSMRTTRPAARPPHPFFELRAHPFDMLPPCLIFLDGDGPADPLVARELRDVFPGRQRLRVGRERLAEISRKVMCDSPGDSNGCHSVVPQATAKPGSTHPRAPALKSTRPQGAATWKDFERTQLPWFCSRGSSIGRESATRIGENPFGL